MVSRVLLPLPEWPEMTVSCLSSRPKSIGWTAVKTRFPPRALANSFDRPVASRIMSLPFLQGQAGIHCCHVPQRYPRGDEGDDAHRRERPQRQRRQH